MKVYALWHKENGYEYRWRTLLQFGTSWDIIGSVYMKNPGSASPSLASLDAKTLTELQKFSKSTEWKIFTPDNTMKCIEKLFNASHIAPLQGIIQVFNLFNLKDANFASALKNFKSGHCNSKYLQSFNEDVRNLVHPVYLGWKDLWEDSAFNDNCKKIFDEAKKLAGDHGKKWYLANTLEDKSNHFWHPACRDPKKMEDEKNAFLAMI